MLSKLRAALYGTKPSVFFARHDLDHNGYLDFSEFRRLLRATLCVPPSTLGDADIAAFVDALDSDGEGSAA